MSACWCIKDGSVGRLDRDVNSMKGEGSLSGDKDRQVTLTSAVRTVLISVLHNGRRHLMPAYLSPLWVTWS